MNKILLLLLSFPLLLSADLYLEFDQESQQLNLIENGNLIRSMIASGGREGYPTPVGRFAIIEQIPYKHYEELNIAVHHMSYFYGHYGIHSTLYDESNQLIREEYEKLGTPASGGCIRLSPEDAEWVYKHLPVGTELTVLPLSES